MEFLYLLEAHRTPFLDRFFYAVTQFGSEALFIVIGLALFWCVSKKEGYFLLSVGFFGTILSQFLKLFCQIPRPWIRDPSFTIVESARAARPAIRFPAATPSPQWESTAASPAGIAAGFCARCSLC